MTSVRFSTTVSSQFQEHEEIHYSYKHQTTQYPQKQILPSGNEFQFLRENRNEDLHGIITPKLKNHVFNLIPLIGKTMFYYRPPWLNMESEAYKLIFHEMEAGSKTETLIFPNGNYIRANNRRIVGCKGNEGSGFLSRCYTITSNKNEGSIVVLSKYKTESGGEVRKKSSCSLIQQHNMIFVMRIDYQYFSSPFTQQGCDKTFDQLCRERRQ